MGRANGLHIGARRRGGPYKACLIGWRHTTQVWVYAARKRQLRSLGVPGLILRVLGTFDDADVVPVCGGNDEKSWGWSLADVVSTGHVNNRNRSNSVLATRDYSFCCRASSPNTMVGIGQGRSTVSAV